VSPHDVKLGLVYRWRRLGPLYLVVELLEQDGLVGGHKWMSLEGLLPSGVMNGTSNVNPDMLWHNFQLLDLDSGTEQ